MLKHPAIGLNSGWPSVSPRFRHIGAAGCQLIYIHLGSKQGVSCHPQLNCEEGGRGPCMRCMLRSQHRNNGYAPTAASKSSERKRRKPPKPMSTASQGCAEGRKKQYGAHPRSSLLRYFATSVPNSSTGKEAIGIPTRCTRRGVICAGDDASGARETAGRGREQRKRKKTKGERTDPERNSIQRITQSERKEEKKKLSVLASRSSRQGPGGKGFLIPFASRASCLAARSAPTRLTKSRERRPTSIRKILLPKLTEVSI